MNSNKKQKRKRNDKGNEDEQRKGHRTKKPSHTRRTADEWYNLAKAITPPKGRGPNRKPKRQNAVPALPHNKWIFGDIPAPGNLRFLQYIPPQPQQRQLRTLLLFLHKKQAVHQTYNAEISPIFHTPRDHPLLLPAEHKRTLRRSCMLVGRTAKATIFTY